MCGVTRMNRLRNEEVKCSAGMIVNQKVPKWFDNGSTVYESVM